MVSTVYLIVSGANEAERKANEATLRSEYAALDVVAHDTPGQMESIGSFQAEAGGLRSFVGTFRATAAEITSAISHDWLTVGDLPSDWTYPSE